MHKKVGTLFGAFFIITGMVNKTMGYSWVSVETLGMGFIGIIYVITTLGRSDIFRVVQTMFTLLLGCALIPPNDANSLVPVIVFSIAFTMSTKYFPKLKRLIFLYPIPYIIVAFLSAWTVQEIGLSVLLYTAYMTILYVLHNDKV